LEVVLLLNIADTWPDPPAFTPPLFTSFVGLMPAQKTSPLGHDGAGRRGQAGVVTFGSSELQCVLVSASRRRLPGAQQSRRRIELVCNLLLIQ
jgi:hypothetical protein